MIEVCYVGWSDLPHLTVSGIRTLCGRKVYSKEQATATQYTHRCEACQRIKRSYDARD